MTDGAGCRCNAWNVSECACDADWTPKEVVELRGKVKMLVEALDAIAKYDPTANYQGAVAQKALASLPKEYRV